MDSSFSQEFSFVQEPTAHCSLQTNLIVVFGVFFWLLGFGFVNLFVPPSYKMHKQHKHLVTHMYSRWVKNRFSFPRTCVLTTGLLSRYFFTSLSVQHAQLPQYLFWEVLHLLIHLEYRLHASGNATAD